MKYITFFVFIASMPIFYSPQTLCVKPAYMETDWYKNEGVFIERAQQKKAEQEKQNTERKRLLDAKAIGLYVRNDTKDSAQIHMKIFSPDSKYPNRTIKTGIPAGSTIEILGDALDKNYVYTIAASVGHRFIAHGLNYWTMGGVSIGSAKPGPVAKSTPYISTQKDWSLQHPTNKKIELVLELVEKPGAQPLLILRDK